MRVDQPVNIDKISIKGIKATNDDFIKKQVGYDGIFKSKTLEELFTQLGSVQKRLESLDIFDSVKIVIDKSKTSKKHKYHGSRINLIINVKEKKVKHFSASIKSDTHYRTNFQLSGNMCNLRGRAEKLSVNYDSDLGVNGESSISYIKPLENLPNVKFGIGLWNLKRDYQWNKIFENTTAGYSELLWTSVIGQHRWRIENGLREIKSQENSSLDILKENGLSLKSCFKHTLEKDTRNDAVFPCGGYKVSFGQEVFTDLLRNDRNRNNVAFDNVNLKLDFEFQKAIPFIDNLVLENTLNVGYIQSLTQEETKVSVCDRYFLGGPLDIRGFEFGGIGPTGDSSSDKTKPNLGSHKYIKHGLHLYSTLPFLNIDPDEGGFSSLIRLHGFLTTSISDWTVNSASILDRNRDFKQIASQLLPDIRCTIGGGIVFKLMGTMRVELNYCMPLKFIKGDKINPGMQFGLGIVYL